MSLIWLLLVGALGGDAGGDRGPANLRAAADVTDRAAELSRLVGHEVTSLDDGGYRIDDVAGEGAPRVGVVERRGDALYLLQTNGAAHRLRGPLAVPRISGPGYHVWVVGELRGEVLEARRLGVLRGPSRPL